MKVLCETGFFHEELDNFLIPEDEVVEMMTSGIDITECGLLVLGQGGTHALHSNIGSLDEFIQTHENFCEESGP
jgi:hypothetical protein